GTTASDHQVFRGDLDHVLPRSVERRPEDDMLLAADRDRHAPRPPLAGPSDPGDHRGGLGFGRVEVVDGTVREQLRRVAVVAEVPAELLTWFRRPAGNRRDPRTREHARLAHVRRPIDEPELGSVVAVEARARPASDRYPSDERDAAKPARP